MNATGGGIEPASMNRRFIAYVLDGLVLGFVSFVLLLAMDPTQIERALAQVTLVTLFGLAYFAFSWTQLGGSPFQRALGLRTVSATDGARLTMSQAVRRWAFLYGPGIAVSFIALAPGANAAVWLSVLYALYLYYTVTKDPQRRGLHDHQSGSIVVRETS